MQKKTARSSAPALLAALCAFALAATLCALVHPAKAMADDAIAHSTDASGKYTEYTRVSDALNAAYDGATIVMDTDWDLGSNSLDITEKKAATIDLNGYRITSSNTRMTVIVRERATLTLTSSAKASPTYYNGYSRNDPSDIKSGWGWNQLSVSTGGLITNNTGEGCGFSLQSEATLNLDNVAVVGCGGGIYANERSKVNMTNASVCNNKANWDDTKDGGGIYLRRITKITMRHSHIDDNYSENHGGGVYMNQATNITMSGDSTVSGNTAATGGAVYINDYDEGARIESTDSSSVFARNFAFCNSMTTSSGDKSGGAIHVGESGNSIYCLIAGITVKDNYSAFDAGGIQVDHNGTTIRGCKITGNTCEYEGGGVNIYGDGITLDGCTVTGNACDLSSKNYEGGGVFVGSNYDVNLSNVCVIKGNTRGKDSTIADDVMLRESAFAKAYIKGYLDQGSSVGVRTGTTGDRRIAKNFSCTTKNGLFMDLSDSYYVSYGNDEGGDAWQRHATKGFTLTVNGASEKYKSGTSVVATAPNAPSGKRFWRWEANKSTGLSPVTDYITSKTKYNQSLAFAMPQNDVSLTASYADTVKSGKITVAAPEAGKSLPAMAILTRTDGGAGGSAALVYVSWYEVADNGTAVAAAGKAKAGTTYRMVLAAQQSVENGVFLDDGLSKDSVSVVLHGSDGDKTVDVASAELASSTGQFVMTTADFKTDGQKVDPASESGTLTVQQWNVGLPDGTSETSEASVQAVAALADSDETTPISIGSVTISYDKESDEVSIAAPYVKGYNFCNWEDVKPGWKSDDSEGVVKIPAADLADIDGLNATYTPTVTELTVDLDVPVAGGDLLGGCKKLVAACSNSAKLDFVDELDPEDDYFKVTWSPADGTAVNSTAYSALIELCDAPEGLEGVDNVVAAGAVVNCNNGAKASSASFVVVGGKLCLAVTFPATADDPDKGDDEPDDDESDDETDDGSETDGPGEPEATTTDNDGGDNDNTAIDVKSTSAKTGDSIPAPVVAGAAAIAAIAAAAAGATALRRRRS